MNTVSTLAYQEASNHAVWRPPSFAARPYVRLRSAERIWQRLEAERRCTAFQWFDWTETVVRYLAYAEMDEIRAPRLSLGLCM